MEADYGVLVSNSMHKHTFQTGRAQCSMPADDGAASVSFDKLHSKRHRHAYHDMSYLDDDDDYCERDTAAKRLAVDLSQFSLRDTRNSVCERTRLVGYAPSSASMPLADDVSMQGDYHTEINSADVVVQRGTDNPYSRRMSTNKSQRTATHVLVPMDAAVLESDYDGDDENDTEAGKSIRGVQEHEVIQEFLVCPRDLLQRKHDSRCATPCLEIVPYRTYCSGATPTRHTRDKNIQLLCVRPWRVSRHMTRSCCCWSVDIHHRATPSCSARASQSGAGAGVRAFKTASQLRCQAILTPGTSTGPRGAPPPTTARRAATASPSRTSGVCNGRQPTPPYRRTRQLEWYVFRAKYRELRFAVCLTWTFRARRECHARR
eukprot:m.197677 g.197677  ORF g.197677 m.197677 type:complete len:375 (-) comp18724_c0_seq1:271-1395(-)